jgi:hypothetical protein
MVVVSRQLSAISLQPDRPRCASPRFQSRLGCHKLGLSPAHATFVRVCCVLAGRKKVSGTFAAERPGGCWAQRFLTPFSSPRQEYQIRPTRTWYCWYSSVCSFEGGRISDDSPKRRRPVRSPDATSTGGTLVPQLRRPRGADATRRSGTSQYCGGYGITGSSTCEGYFSLW